MSRPTLWRVPFVILAVCLGNVCRSPLTERLLRRRISDVLGQDSDAVSVSSAGVRALVGHPMDALSAEQLVRLGGDPVGFASTQLTTPMTESASLVLTATMELRSRVLEEAPRALRQTFTLREFAALSAGVEETADPTLLVARVAQRRRDLGGHDYDIPDPIGQAADVHRHVADLVEASCTATARALAPALLSGSRP